MANEVLEQTHADGGKNIFLCKTGYEKRSTKKQVHYSFILLWSIYLSEVFNKTNISFFCIFVFIKNAIIINIRIYEVRFNDYNYILWVVYVKV